MEFNVRETIETPNAWDHCVENGGGGTVFHTAEWLNLISSGSVPLRYGVVEKDETIVGVYPFAVQTDSFRGIEYRYADSLPRCEVGGPAVLTDRQAVTDTLLSGLREYCTRNGMTHVESTLDARMTPSFGILRDHGMTQSVTHCDPIVKLSNSFERTRERFNKERRRELRRAGENESLKIRRGLTESFGTHYELYRTTIESVGGHVYGESFLQGLVDATITETYSATIDGELAAWFLHLTDGHDWYHVISASDPNYHSSFPVQALHGRSMREATDSGAQRYHLGGTPADFRNGLFGFKDEWNPSYVPKVTFVDQLRTAKGIGRQIVSAVQSGLREV